MSLLVQLVQAIDASFGVVAYLRQVTNTFSGTSKHSRASTAFLVDSRGLCLLAVLVALPFIVHIDKGTQIVGKALYVRTVSYRWEDYIFCGRGALGAGAGARRGGIAISGYMPPKRKQVKGSLFRLPVSWHVPQSENTCDTNSADNSIPTMAGRSNAPSASSASSAGSIHGAIPQPIASAAPSNTADANSSSASSTLKIANRKDAPLTIPYTRGSLAAALASAEDKEETVNSFEKKVFANSTHSTRASHLKTWCTCHQRWFGPSLPTCPLTVVSIQAIMAMLVKGGYRSADAYLSRAKDAHMEEHEWNTQLFRAQKRANAAAKRGRGPSHQAGEFPLDQAAPLANQLESQVPQPGPFGGIGFPLNFETYMVTACFFVLREIECSLILLKSVVLDIVNLKLTILLPVSKTDPEAVSCSRSWSCVCGDRPHDRCRPCPVHSMIEHMELLKQYFGEPLDGDLPLFPDVDGGISEKHRVAQGLEYLLGKLNIPLTGSDGRPAFGGHSFRVTGSRMLARRGIPVEVIMILARWQSSVILRYIQSAPLQALAQLYKAADVESSEEPKKRKLKAISDESQQQFSGDQIKTALHAADVAKEAATRLEAEVESLRGKFEELKAQAVPVYISNDTGLGCIHAVGTNFVSESPAAWRTKCGWRYSAASFSRIASIEGVDPERLCDKCFP